MRAHGGAHVFLTVAASAGIYMQRLWGHWMLEQ